MMLKSYFVGILQNVCQGHSAIGFSFFGNSSSDNSLIDLTFLVKNLFLITCTV